MGELSEKECTIETLSSEIEDVRAKETGSRKQVDDLQNKVTGRISLGSPANEKPSRLAQRPTRDVDLAKVGAWYLERRVSCARSFTNWAHFYSICHLHFLDHDLHILLGGISQDALLYDTPRPCDF